MAGIFVSYRRGETTGYAGWLRDMLTEVLAEHIVFRDIDSIEPGLDFVEAVQRAVGSCEVLLAVIGKSWLTATDETGRPRLDDPYDYVRMEISAALNRKTRVIPVLVQGASMPRTDELPDDLADLTRRNAVELHDTNWESDVGRLISTLEQVVSSGETRENVERRTRGGAAYGALRVKRLRQWVGSDSPIEIYLDDKKIGDVRKNRDISFEAVPTGEHRVRVQPKREWDVWYPDKYSSELTVYISSGKVVNLLCGNEAWALSGVQTFLRMED